MTEETITITLQLSKEQADFVDAQWSLDGCASREEYLRKLVVRAIRDEAGAVRSFFDPDEQIPF